MKKIYPFIETVFKLIRLLLNQVTFAGYVANYFKDKCIRIEPGSVSWLNPWAFFPLLLSSIGIILTLEVNI